jgi:hypothetical protein
MKYTKLLKMCKEKITESLAPLRSHEMLKKAELEVAKLDSDIACKENLVNEAKSEYPIDFDKIINAIDDVELTKLKRERMEDIIADLFE